MAEVMNTFDLIARNSNWSPELKASIYQNTINLFSKIDYIKTVVKNPIGLMVGKIQSGKTGNLIGAAAHAFDKGFRLVILYLSDTYALYEQNMLRVKESFKTDNNSIIFIDNSKQSNDLSMYEKSPSDIDFHLNKGRCFVVCTLKHNKRINTISEVFSKSKITKQKVMIIDDEGDDISQNTNKQKHKNINDDTLFTPNNKAIVELMKKFDDYIYLSVTATPQAPLLIYKFENLSPNFCSLIYPGNGYVGLNTFHSGELPHLVSPIDDFKKLTQESNGIPLSLKKALIYFLVTGLLRKVKLAQSETNFYHSFLIHVDKLIIKQNDIFSRFQTYINKVLIDFRIYKTRKTNEITIIENLIDELVVENAPRLKDLNSYSRNELLVQALNILEEVKLVLLNGEQEVKNLKRTVSGRNFFIVIGGDLLDRGLTIDGLTVSYFTRESKKSQADTLLQRARWYGYKSDYINYCRLFTSQHIIDQFEAALDHENTVWDFLEIYENSKLDLRLVETQFKLDTSLLSPTSSAKAKWNNQGVERWFVQNYFSRNPIHQSENSNLIDQLFKTDTKVINFKSNFDNKFRKLDYSGLITFVQKFKFSQIQKKDLLSYISLLEKVFTQFKNLEFEVVYLRYKTGEERKLIIDQDGDYLSNIMQGRSQNLGEYPGDREIINSNPMLQIHRVILKSDSGEFKKGDNVYTLAFGLPKDFVLDNLISSKMDKPL
jgi:hypothetical protein